MPLFSPLFFFFFFFFCFFSFFLQVPEVERTCVERLGCVIKQVWGMSELSPLGTVTSDHNLRPYQQSIGQVMSDTQVRLFAQCPTHAPFYHGAVSSNATQPSNHRHAR